jgi:tetratricopeptide (TPR) repeat protein
MPRDNWGYELSTPSDAAAAAYNDAITVTLANNAGAERLMASALDHDPGFALAEIASARQAQFLGRMPEAQERKGRALSAAAGATRREQQHVTALAAAVDGDTPRAISLIKEHCAEFPRDAFLLSQCVGPFSLVGFGGGPDWRAENFAMLEPHVDAYGDDWWFLSSFAFAHNELYHFAQARELAERSLELSPRTGHGSHTMAHVLFETGEHATGSAFLDGWLPGYDRTSTIFHHLAWHLALFELNQGNAGRVIEVFERDLKPVETAGSPLIYHCDNAALLWRCDLYGVQRPAGSRADQAAYAATAFGRAGVAFADVHSALSYAAAGDRDRLDALVSQLRKRDADGKQPAGGVVVAVVEGIRAVMDGDFEGAVAILEPCRAAWVRIGGSNAQRQVIEDTLLESYLRTGRVEAAKALLKERLDRRPSKRDQALLAGVAA